MSVTGAPVPGQSVHLVAVGGVGMSALAGLLQARGYRVTGSDNAVYPPASILLEKLGIEVRQGYSSDHIADADLVVVGNAVTRANPEAIAATERGIPMWSMPQLLGELFLADRLSIVVAGTHGKTTTSAMLAWVLEQAGYSPGFLVGGASLNLQSNFAVGTGEHFVLEGDEYDSAYFDKQPKFLHYRPRALLLNAIEFDHADIYRDLDHVKSAFRQLMQLLSPDTPLIVAQEFPHAVEIASTGPATPVLFGMGSGCAWRAVDVRDDGERTSFSVLTDGHQIAEVRLQVPGVMNIRNALGVFVLSCRLGLAVDQIVRGLESFRGVRRRQERVGEVGGVIVIDDFAHHPTAVAGTLAAIRGRYPDRRVIAVFEPRSNTSRRRIFQHEFAEALAGAPVVILSAVFRKPNDPLPPEESLSIEELVDDLASRGIEAQVLPSADAIIEYLGRTARPGDVITVMSNGSFEGLPRRLVERLSGS